jgi:integrase
LHSRPFASESETSSERRNLNPHEADSRRPSGSSFCSLRQSSAVTMLLARGVHVKHISEMLVHATITLTLDTYSHVIPTMHGDAAAAIDAMLTA